MGDGFLTVHVTLNALIQFYLGNNHDRMFNAFMSRIDIGILRSNSL